MYLLAYGITFLHGKGGLEGWQWIFLLEALLTILLGFLAWLYIPDFPDKAKFINEEQRKVCHFPPIYTFILFLTCAL